MTLKYILEYTTSHQNVYKDWILARGIKECFQQIQIGSIIFHAQFHRSV